MKTALKVCILISLIIGITSVYWYQNGRKSFASYAYPEEWNEIYAGMSANKAHEVVPDLDSALREVKGFDDAGVNHGRCCWMLWVHIDGEGKVSSVERRFIDRENGLFSRSWINGIERK